MSEKLQFPSSWASRLAQHLPTHKSHTSPTHPFVTLTFATSLDSGLSLAPGVRTRLSGPDSKAMTHYLRSQHDAILVGIGTMLADDPALNCRIEGAEGSQPRPVVVDPGARWCPKREDKVLRVCREGEGKAPFVVTARRQDEVPIEGREVLEEHGGKYITVNATPSGPEGKMRFAWKDILRVLKEQGLESVMIEGGGQLINSLLAPENHDLVDSVIVTIAPVWLGQGSVTVSPERVADAEGTALPVARLSNVAWHPFGEDVVLCGSLRG